MSCIFTSSTLACVVHPQGCKMVTSLTSNLDLRKDTHQLSSAICDRPSNYIVSVTLFFPLPFALQIENVLMEYKIKGSFKSIF